MHTVFGEGTMGRSTAYYQFLKWHIKQQQQKESNVVLYFSHFNIIKNYC